MKETSSILIVNVLNDESATPNRRLSLSAWETGLIMSDFHTKGHGQASGNDTSRLWVWLLRKQGMVATYVTRGDHIVFEDRTVRLSCTLHLAPKIDSEQLQPINKSAQFKDPILGTRLDCVACG
jgi:hypothetical protein